MKLFLDDERLPANTGNDWVPICVGETEFSVLVENFNRSDWVIARTVDAAKATVLHDGCPSLIMFDHDLQTEDTGLTFAKWLVDQDMDHPGFMPADFVFYVHSQNVNGAENIQRYLDQYLEQRGQADVRASTTR